MSKEKIQQLFLFGLLAVAGLYVYFFLLLGPLGTREANALKQLKKLEPEIAAAKTQINRTAAIPKADANAAAAGEIRQTLESAIPGGAAIAWFPARMREFFTRHGIEESGYRPTPDTPSAILPDYRNSEWEITLPKVEFGRFANALAALENGQGLLQVHTLQIDAVPTDAQAQRVRLTLSTLVKQ